MTSGYEWVIDAYGCAPASLRDVPGLRALLDTIVKHAELHMAQAPLVHPFPGAGGVTAMILLMESHLTCHTYPEAGYAAFNLYVCKPRPALAWDALLRHAVQAQRVVVRGFARGDG